MAEIKSPPELVPVVAITPAGHFLFPGHDAHISLEENEVRSGYYDRIKTCGYAVLAIQTHGEDGTAELSPLGVLGRVTKTEKQQSDYLISFECAVRVRYELTSGAPKDKVPMVRWTEIIDEPIPPETFQLSSFRPLLDSFKQLFRDLMARVTWNEAAPPTRTLAEKTVAEMGSLENYIAQDKLTALLNDVMDVLHHIEFTEDSQKVLERASRIIFQQTNVIERLSAIGVLLKIFAHPPQVVVVGEETEHKKTGQKTTPTKEELINFLFWDDTGAETSSQETAGEILELPEDAEITSISDLKKYMAQRVIGQERAIRTIGRALNLAKARNFPKEGSLLKVIFAGPKGVGKTELALALADWLWEAEKKALARAKEQGKPSLFIEAEIAKPPFVKIPCGDFAGENSHGVSDLIGSPTGYAGSRGTQNAHPPVLRPELFPPNRMVVLLFDEIEKAFLGARNEGAELMGIMVEFMNTGKYRNRWGEEVDFSRTIVICTSNVGSVKIMQSAKEPTMGIRPRRNGNGRKKRRLTEEEIERLNEKIYDTTRDEYAKTFRPEFRDRLGRLIVFRFLTDSEYHQIVQKVFKEEVLEWAEKVAGIKVELTEETANWILEELKFEEGVRDLREFVRKEISEPLARAHNLQRLKRGKTYVVRIKKGGPQNGSKITNGETDIKAEFHIKPESA